MKGKLACKKAIGEPADHFVSLREVLNPRLIGLRICQCR